jgi:hypothetical protein
VTHILRQGDIVFCQLEPNLSLRGTQLPQARLAMRTDPKSAYAIKKREGSGGKMYSYVKHGYVTDQLNKCFGFDWDFDLQPIENGKMFSLQVEVYNQPIPGQGILKSKSSAI